MRKKVPVSIGVASAGIILLSLLSCLGIAIPYATIHGGWTKVLLFLARTEPLGIVLGPLSYVLSLLQFHFVVSFFLAVCGIMLFSGKNWARKFLLVYCWANLVFLFMGYFLEKLFVCASLQTLNGQAISILVHNPDFKGAYLRALNPASHDSPAFLLYFLFPVLLFCSFIFLLTRPKVENKPQ